MIESLTTGVLMVVVVLMMLMAILATIWISLIIIDDIFGLGTSRDWIKKKLNKKEKV